ncbi:MAG: hypothetical protein H6977_08100 [Gammaproteobacteria bacterium]|nr:hypothetical protein [Gammaproteobacteria bacterium]
MPPLLESMNHACGRVVPGRPRAAWPTHRRCLGRDIVADAALHRLRGRVEVRLALAATRCAVRPGRVDDFIDDTGERPRAGAT